MSICSLGFWDIREYVTLWRLILRSLGCVENKMEECFIEHLEYGEIGPRYNLIIMCS
jgi:hypothetical protein